MQVMQNSVNSELKRYTKYIVNTACTFFFFKLKKKKWFCGCVVCFSCCESAWSRAWDVDSSPFHNAHEQSAELLEWVTHFYVSRPLFSPSFIPWAVSVCFSYRYVRRVFQVEDHLTRKTKNANRITPRIMGKPPDTSKQKVPAVLKVVYKWTYTWHSPHFTNIMLVTHQRYRCRNCVAFETSGKEYVLLKWKA